MPVVLIVLLAWFALDALLVGGWLALVARDRRLRVRAMVADAERYANVARPARTDLIHH